MHISTYSVEASLPPPRFLLTRAERQLLEQNANCSSCPDAERCQAVVHVFVVAWPALRTFGAGGVHCVAFGGSWAGSSRAQDHAALSHVFPPYVVVSDSVRYRR